LLFPITISIGGLVASLENQNQEVNNLSFGDLVALAEQSLLQAQKSGGNRDRIETISNG
jgi:GGDEF domain-containing protein